jgi:hypothetical protein
MAHRADSMTLKGETEFVADERKNRQSLNRQPMSVLIAVEVPETWSIKRIIVSLAK